MPRIRKKTSKRISTHQRAKFKHKVAEGRKKKKKEAKKNPQWKAKKKKDPGIPNNFPYKDQILAEVAETRRQVDEAKQRRKEEKKAAREGLLVEEVEIDLPDDRPSGITSSSRSQIKEEAPLLLNPDLPDLKAVLGKADVVLHVLDARDPTSYRLPHLEKLALANEGTKLAFVLSKIDLVPREALTAWVKQLRTQHATFLFRSASSFLPKTILNDPKAKGKEKELADDATGAETLLEYLGRHAGRVESDTLQVAMVGLTNSGKSAIVNSLARKAVVPIYNPTPSTDAWKTTTSRAFEVPVEVAGHKINFIDTPGVSFSIEPDHPETLRTRDMLLRCRGRVDKVKDPAPAVENIVSRADTQDLMVHYSLPAFAPGDCHAFLAGVARSSGLFKKGGAADLTQTARSVLRDWATGKLPFYTDAPKEGDAADLVDGRVDEPSLVQLYARGDELALSSARTRREMRKVGGLVRIERGAMEGRLCVVDAPFVVEEGDGDSESGEGEDEDEEEGDEEYRDEDDEEGDEKSHDEEHEEELPTPPLTGKRKRKEAAGASVAHPTKKVAFAPGTHDRNEKKHARSATKSTTKPTPRAPPAKSPSTKVAAGKAKTGTSVTTGNDADAYDFDQFFKS